MKALIVGARSQIAQATVLEFLRYGVFSIAAIREPWGDVFPAKQLLRLDSAGFMLDEAELVPFQYLIFAAGAAANVPLDKQQPLKVIWASYTLFEYFLRKALPLLYASGGGHIVYLSSFHGSLGTYPGRGAYASAKAAGEALVRVAALEGGPKRVYAFALAPGHLVQPMQGSSTSEMLLQRAKEHTPIGELITAQDVAKVIVWLCLEPAARFFTGQTLHLNGGFSVNLNPEI